MKDSSYLYEAGFDNITIRQCVSAFITSNKPIECQVKQQGTHETNTTFYNSLHR